MNYKKESQKIKPFFSYIKAPEEMRDRLNEALVNGGAYRQPKAKKLLNRRIAVIAASLIAAILLYSFDAMAYYVKKLSDYDTVMEGSIKALNDAGQGQSIEKSCSFSNGDRVNLDKIFFDDNQLIVYYTYTFEEAREHPLLPRIELSGLFPSPRGYTPEGGMAKRVDEHTYVGMETYQPPAFYEKWMNFKVSISVNGRGEERVVPFTLIRNQAMFKTVHQKITKQVTLGNTTISFKELSASPLSTRITGEIDGFDENSFEQSVSKSMKSLYFDILFDKSTPLKVHCSLRTENGHTTFEGNTDALPSDFTSATIGNIRYETMKVIDKTLDISSYVNLNTPLDKVIAEDLTLKEVRQEGKQLFVALESQGIPIFGIFSEEEQLPCLNQEAYDWNPKKKLMQTFIFEGQGSALELKIKAIKYVEATDDKLPIE